VDDAATDQTRPCIQETPFLLWEEPAKVAVARETVNAFPHTEEGADLLMRQRREGGALELNARGLGEAVIDGEHELRLEGQHRERVVSGTPDREQCAPPLLLQGRQ
jgi:hypothetical protein